MWLMLNDGFVSLVQKDPKKSSLLCARSRVKAHLEQLFPGSVIESESGTDYQFRCYVTREEVADVLVDRVLSLDYSNFKSSVQDRPLHDAYMNVWTVMHDYGMQVESVSRRERSYRPYPTIRRR
jgi:hypothetical protein